MLMLLQLDEGKIDVETCLFDESIYFKLNKFINKKSCQIVGMENPHMLLHLFLQHSYLDIPHEYPRSFWL